MTTYHFVWLGSKRAKKNHVNEKGWRLDIATRRGLPVPNGGILLEDVYWLALQEGVAVQEADQILIPSPSDFSHLLFSIIRFPQLDKPCAVRSLSGRQVPPCLPINLNDPQTLASAVSRLWTAVLPAPETVRRDLLVQEIIEIQERGTAVSLAADEVDIIRSQTQTTSLSRLGRWQRTQADSPAHLQRLQKLMGGVRRTFGSGDWQVTWADDGQICWLLEVVTTAREKAV